MTRLEYPSTESIAYLEADINYTIFHLKDGKKVVTSFTLKKYEKNSYLQGFLRVHKSFLLNPDFIETIEKEGKKATVNMQDGTKVRVSRRRLHLVTSFKAI